MARSWIEGAFETADGDDLISVWLFINSDEELVIGGARMSSVGRVRFFSWIRDDAFFQSCE